ALHPLAVQRRQQQLALLHVGFLVQEQQRVLAQDREQDAVPLAGVEHPWIARENLLDVLRVGQHDPGSLLEDPQRERVAEARRALREHPLGPPDPDPGLERGRHARAGRQDSIAVQHAGTSRPVTWPAAARPHVQGIHQRRSAADSADALTSSSHTRADATRYVPTGSETLRNQWSSRSPHCTPVIFPAASPVESLTITSP